MKKLLTAAAALFGCTSLLSLHAQQPSSSGYPITPVPFTSVKVAPASFWGQRLQASRSVTVIPTPTRPSRAQHTYCRPILTSGWSTMWTASSTS